MNGSLRLTSTLLASLLLAGPLAAQPISVDVWTDRGDEAVYQPGDPLQVSVQATVDGHLLLYEIDAEGSIHVLFPIAGFDDYVAAGEVYDVPDAQTDLELVVQGPTGQGFIVAIISRQPFEDLPWYLRPIDAQAEALGYHGVADEEEGVTAEGRIVGDPFVAMERIRRRVITDDQNADAFATSYTTYYLHEAVKYPRYICSDCHRPGHWTWWAGFDPYYATCSAFTFHVNAHWYWGPGYWFGYVPRYVYTCRPGYGWGGRYWYSGWSGWSYWCSIWSGPLVRVYSKPPAHYIPPYRYKDDHGRWRKGMTPPGLMTTRVIKGNGMRQGVPLGRNLGARGDRTPTSRGQDVVKPGRLAGRLPVRGVRGPDLDATRGGVERRPMRQLAPRRDRDGLAGRKPGVNRLPARGARPEDRGTTRLGKPGASKLQPQRSRTPGTSRALKPGATRSGGAIRSAPRVSTRSGVLKRPAGKSSGARESKASGSAVKPAKPSPAPKASVRPSGGQRPARGSGTRTGKGGGRKR